MRTAYTSLLVCLLCVVNHGLVASSSLEELGGGGGVGELMFDITWPGKLTDATHRKIHSPSAGTQQQFDSVSTSSNDLQSLEEADPSNKLLPNGLLPEFYESGPVMFTTSDREKYKCVLPEVVGLGEERKKVQDGSSDVDPENLLSKLSGKCTRLLMGYWTYELCHGEFVRQFHEEKQTPEQSKLDEYYLGRVDRKESSLQQPASPTSSNFQDKVPVWHYSGKNYPYHMIEMGGGTPCELMEGQLRSVNIKFICDVEAHPTGSFLHIEEIQTCKYEAVIATTQLCQNHAYRLKENPVHNIQCYAMEDSPRRPTILLEHELTSVKFHPLGGSSKKISGSMKGQEGEGLFRDSYRDLDNYHRGLQTDEQFARNFLSGETCLLGGSSGWWQHEICYGKYVRQIHEASAGFRQEVYLGYWNEEGHKKWFKKTGKRKRSKVHVIHLYQDGDICDMTRQPRQCQVKLKCGKHLSSTHISLFLEEPTTCNYVLTVESGFLCPYIKNAHEDGLISLDTLTDTQNAKEGDASSIKDSDKSLQTERTSSLLTNNEDDSKRLERHGDVRSSSQKDSKDEKGKLKSDREKVETEEEE